MKKFKNIIKEQLVSTEYRIYRGEIKDFVLDHWYPNWLFRVTVETFIYEYAERSKAKQSYHINTEYCYRLNNFSGCKHPECWAWCATRTVALNVDFKIDWNFLICSKLIRHISEEEENKLFYDIQKEKINYEIY